MKDPLVSGYKRYLRRRWQFIALMIVLILGLSLYGLISGSADIGLKDILGLFTGKGSGFTHQVILNIRLPRIVGAILAGTGLAVSGAVIQSLLHNPLASPYTLGISGGAAFGAAFAIVVMGAGSAYHGSHDMAMIDNPYLVTISAFIWSLLGVLLILSLSKYKGATPEMIILSGIILSSLFTAGISAMQYFADDVQLASIVFWSFGDLGRASWDNLWILAIVLIPLTVYFLWKVWTYKSLQSGDEYAVSLGVNVKAERLRGMVAATLATAIVVSFYGVIAFVGLVVPHMVRRITGSDEQFLIPASAAAGGAFLLFSDTLARTVIQPVILPVGILTSFVGAPLFLFLLMKSMRRL